ncbi:alkane 1-monooxygenase [Hydrocarboniphaga sp.]|uniref:alkane 1-monooxygenase n=1 Tax=Hydrocarboniphaga sp. TaxID=2033016 RepID=UPI003D128A5B
MTDYLKYWVPVAILATATVGLSLGGDWVWLGVATFPALAVIDSLLPRDYSTRRIGSPTLANIPIWICSVGPVLLYGLLVWRVTHSQLSGVQLFGAILSVAWMSVIPLIPAAHELYHMRGRIARTVGHYAHLCILDCTRDIGHVVGHHIDVATVDDGDTAPRGRNLYLFTANSVLESTRYAFNKEAEALRKRGLSSWNIRHRAYRAALALLLFHVVMFSIGGWTGVLCALGAQLIARCWVESFNYFQHYGLVRVPGATIGRRHVWNHLGWLSRTSTFEITNHADHHQNSYQPYYALKPHRQSIEMPSVFVCFLTALLPPVWHHLVIMPALKRWDLEYATPEERALAAAQNRRAGWPDWFNESYERSGSARPATIGI